MFGFIEKMVAKKARVRVVIRGIRRENYYFIQTAARSWNIPGKLKVLGDGALVLEIEGLETVLHERLAELSRNAYVGRSVYPLEISWLPYKGEYPSFTFGF